MGTLQAFKDIAPYLSDPLVLTGFVLLLFFGIHRSLLKARIILPLTTRTGGKVVQLLLRYGFLIALLVIVLGFGLAFYKIQKESEISVSADRQRAEWAEQAKVALEKRLDDMKRQLSASESRAEEFQELSKTLAEAVNSLAQQPGPGIDEALTQLTQGNTAAAKAVFQRVIQAEAPAVKEAAAAWRHLGALAFLDDTEETLSAYRRATELDPENADGWTQFGHLLRRNGELQAAESAYQKVSELGESSSDRSLLAIAYGNLGIIYKIRGELGCSAIGAKRFLGVIEEGQREPAARWSNFFYDTGF